MSELDNNEDILTSEPVGTEENTAYRVETDKDSNAFGIISMICGIMSLICCCTRWGAVVLGVTAVVLGIMSLKGQEKAKGMAIAGIICGCIGLIIIIVLMVIMAQDINTTLNSTDNEAVKEYVEQIIERFWK